MVQRAGITLTIVLAALLGATPGVAGKLRGADRTFVTWRVFEADKCASIWLIRRFIAPDAVIRFYERDEDPPPGIAFDTPEARFRRYHNRSTFETLVEHYGVPDEGVDWIGRIVHDIEVNIWERKVFAETRHIEAQVMGLVSDRDPVASVDACVRYFDQVHSDYLSNR